MGSDKTTKIQRVHTNRSQSRPSSASPNETTLAQEPKRRKKKQDSEDSTGRKPPKKMAVAQAQKIMARKDLWGYRMLRKGFDPKATVGTLPTASIISFGGGGESRTYPISLDHALCDKLLGPEDLVERPQYVSQARMPSAQITRGVVIAHEPNPSSNFHTSPEFPFPYGPLPRPLSSGDPRLYYRAPFPSPSSSPQPGSEASGVELESISSAGSYNASSSNGSFANFDGLIDGWTLAENTAVVLPYRDPRLSEQMPSSVIGFAEPSAPEGQPSQPDWMTECAMMAHFQNTTAPLFPFDQSNSLTSVFDYPNRPPFLPFGICVV
ncbi:hypothetical protein MD484_g4805, partial [Candolleomyces efflorescens]